MPCSHGSAEDEHSDEVAKLAKIRPMRVEMFFHVPVRETLAVAHTLQARVKTLQRAAGRLLQTEMILAVLNLKKTKIKHAKLEF